MKSFLIACCLLLGSLASFAAAERWTPLWDGRTFNGWHLTGKGEWTIMDGAIRGRQVKEQSEYGHLVSDLACKDFTIRLKFKAVRGNSGLYFRIEEKGFSGVSGFQAEIDAENDVGGLYETNGRSWVSKPKPEDVKRWFKPGEWNEMTVAAKGGDIVVTVNGHKTSELTNDPGRTEGKFALQVHGAQDVEVWFKEIELKVE
jgi:hypothetical protein